MSAALLLLQFILSIFQFLLSVNGIAVLGFGLVAFIAMPIVPRILGVGYGLAGFHIGLAKWLLGRVAIVVSEHNDLLWKQMRFDDLGVEEMQFGSATKTFEDPAAALHYWGRSKFALADEVSGVLFDPRHAALGEHEREATESGIVTRRATKSERKAYDIYEWTLGVFEMPRQHEITDLSAVRQIVGGGERAEYSDRMEELYKLSRKPFASQTPMLRLAMPVLALLGVFGAMWIMATQGSSSGGNTETISFGTLLLIGSGGGLVAVAKRAADNIVTAVKYVILVATLPTLFLVLAVVVGPFLAGVMAVVAFMGFCFIPLMALCFKPVDKVAGGMSRYLLLKTGMLGYDRPVLEWTPTGYRLREWRGKDTAEQPTWYSFAGGVLGFSFPPEEESWGPDVMSPGQVESMGETAITDGGDSAAIPAGYTRAPSFKRDLWAAYVPKTTNSDSYYLNSGIALQRFTDAAVGERCMKTLLWAKEEYGAGEFGWMDDKRLAILTVFMALVGAVMGTVIFFL